MFDLTLFNRRQEAAKYVQREELMTRKIAPILGALVGPTVSQYAIYVPLRNIPNILVFE